MTSRRCVVRTYPSMPLSPACKHNLALSWLLESCQTGAALESQGRWQFETKCSSLQTHLLVLQRIDAQLHVACMRIDGASVLRHDIIICLVQELWRL